MTFGGLVRDRFLGGFYSKVKETSLNNRPQSMRDIIRDIKLKWLLFYNLLNIEQSIGFIILVNDKEITK